jgi:hypothetical protein
VVVALAMACFAAVRAQGESSFDTSWGWVQGQPIGSKLPDEARKAADKKQSEDWYRTRLQNYLRINGAFGWP